MPKAIKVYASQHCGPCREVTELLSKGRFESNISADTGVDVVDVESEEGYKALENENIGAVPTAKYNGKTCKLEIDREEMVVVITCPETEDSPAPEDSHTDTLPPEA